MMSYRFLNYLSFFSGTTFPDISNQPVTLVAPKYFTQSNTATTSISGQHFHRSSTHDRPVWDVANRDTGDTNVNPEQICDNLQKKE